MLHQQSSILGPKWRGGEGEGCWPWQADHWSLITLKYPLHGGKHHASGG